MWVSSRQSLVFMGNLQFETDITFTQLLHQPLHIHKIHKSWVLWLAATTPSLYNEINL